MSMPTGEGDKEYVFVLRGEQCGDPSKLSETSGSSSSLSVSSDEDAPTVLGLDESVQFNYLEDEDAVELARRAALKPALDASTQITKFEGYAEAVSEAQQSLDSRLLAYSHVKYLAPVAPFGDCMFLSIEQLLLYSEDCDPLPTDKIRHVASNFFLAHYKSCTDEEKSRIDSAIRNLYCPSLQGGWGVSPMQTRRFIARKSDRDWLLAKCVELQDQGYSRMKAAEAVYSKFARAVVNAEAYCDYMAIGFGENEHDMIALHYSRSGLVSVDCDPNQTKVAWGDDFALEALATAYQRDIFVVLVGCGKMFFLPHRPQSVPDLDETTVSRSKGNAPWFLLMRLTGSDRGGDHYEPMFAERLRGDGSSEFGSIGD
ncbi:hypothetical protein P43SY_001889 [Pythium insidiosum]|uniref:OTU domain-containing protein n=1 Tax=Pythium insidiosum TaxID=114742 RepID=A0AAD5LZV9_PYTIN|nr:hypothetical protein P43SY_001889 [Pythium insidiosum]